MGFGTNVWPEILSRVAKAAFEAVGIGENGNRKTRDDYEAEIVALENAHAREIGALETQLSNLRDSLSRETEARIEWQTRARYAESEISAAMELPSTIGPAPGELARIIRALRIRAGQN